MKMYLETSRIVLREFEPYDHKHIRDLDSDPEVMKYLTHGRPSDEKEVERVMSVVTDFRKKHEGRYGYWVALEKETGEFIGWFHLRPRKEDPDNFKVLELGYRLKRKFWGKGIGTEGSLELVKKGFEELEADEVCALALLGNKASQKVMQKVGMKFDRNDVYPPFPGPDKRTVWYSIKKEDYFNS